MNNILIVFYVDETKDVFSFSPSKTVDQALADSRGSFRSKEIKKYFYVKDSPVGMSIFKNYATLTSDNQLSVENKDIAIDNYLASIRVTRNDLLKNLDIEFIKALEFEAGDLKNHIKKIKGHLRALPQIARQHMRDMTPTQISKYNAFGNIYEAVVVRQGSGYKSAPEVHIEPPRGQYEGVTARAVAFIDGDKVVKVEIIDPGAGYTKMPKLTIDEPEDGTPAFAIVSPPENMHASIAVYGGRSRAVAVSESITF
jgi:hypothetical protein